MSESGVTYQEIEYEFGYTFSTGSADDYPTQTMVTNAIVNVVERDLRRWLGLSALDTSQKYVDAVISLTNDWINRWRKNKFGKGASSLSTDAGSITFSSKDGIYPSRESYFCMMKAGLSIVDSTGDNW